MAEPLAASDAPPACLDARVEFGVLGPVVVTAEDGDRTPRGRRALDLLAVLLLRRDRAVAPDVLLDLVWGEEAVGLDVSVVHTQMARLRRAIGTDAVATTPSGYRLEDPATDAERFLRLVGQARGAGRADQMVGLLEEARGLWRGAEAYAGVRDGIAAAESSRLGEARVAADELLVETLLARPDRESALRAQQVARELVARQPLREHAHELAMLAAARLDEQAEALEVYERLRRTLRDELGVDPGRSVQQLHARVLAQDTGLLLPRSTADVRATAVLPVPVTGLVAREAELAQLLEAVATRRIVTVVGHGGVGKTRLVLALADELMSQRDLVFADLSTVSDAGTGTSARDAVLAAVARAVGTGAADDLPGLCAALGERALLVVLDEAEHDLGTVADLVATVTAACPGVVFLVTSRAPLEVVGEVRLPLGPLAVPDDGADGEAVRGAPAVALLLERLRDHTPDLVVGPEDLELVAEFTRRLDGLPLAIELVAGYAGSHALGEIDEMLDSPLDLTAADVGRPARHRSLRQALLWTYDRLPEERHRVLRRLAVFGGPFDLPAVRSVVGRECGTEDRIDAAVRALVRDSLIQVDRHRGELRFRMLRTVRDLMLERLGSDDDLPEIRARHREWFASPYPPGSAPLVLAHVQQHYDDHLAALESAVSVGDGADALALLLRLAAWWEAREINETARRWTTRVLESVPLDPSQHARVLALRGNLLSHLDAEAGRADMLAALPRLEQDADGEGLVLTHAGLALELTTSGRHQDAVRHAVAGVAAARRWLPSRLAVALAVQASVSVERDAATAERVAGEAYDLLLATDVGDDAAGVAANVAWTLLATGRPHDALTVLEHAVAALPADAVPTYVTIHVGWARLLAGDAAGALSCFATSLAREQVCESRWHADVLTGAGCALAALGHPDAATLLDGAEALVERSGHTLAGWQVAARQRARDRVPAASPRSWAATRDGAGATLAALVRDASA